MGFFSWKTNDTEKSIANVHSYMEAFEVTMQDDKGNKWVEKEYDGYGVFGGKDYYQLLAEMNRPKLCTGDRNHDRDIGIRLQYGERGIKNKETGTIYLAHDLDFFNWDSDILPHGLSANASLDTTDQWEKITIKDGDIKYPSLTENPDHKWDGDEPLNCEYQGFFY